MQSLPAYHIGSYKTSFILCSTQEGHISSADVAEQEGRGADEDISFFHELVKTVTKDTIRLEQSTARKVYHFPSRR